MKTLILASSSIQRQKLLKQLGILFRVTPSRALEKTKIETTCAALVEDNALRKAQAVAEKIKKGTVIGADTVVYLGHKKIVLKPRNLKEAKKNLKILFSKPQRVYTGVAVIDAQTGQKFVDHEKTKVFMTPLSDEEIDRYHNKVSPLDKAGGFDIEGHGSIFIRRIEGCYTNVIGLPISKLASMLKKMGVSLLGMVCVINLMGCVHEYNLATQQEENLLYGTEKEISIGQSVSQQVEKQYKINTDVDLNERVEKVLDKIVAVCDRRDLVFFIKVIDEDLMNAVSLPGGYIYVFRGILDKVDNDDQLAGVIAHEVGHITAKHAIKQLQNIYGAMLLQLATAQVAPRVTGAVNFALTSLFLEHSQQDEFMADRLGIKYMRKAGYDPQEMVIFLGKLQKEHEKEPLRLYSYWRTHPHIPERIASAKQEVTGKMEFKDYIQLIGTER